MKKSFSAEAISLLGAGRLERPIALTQANGVIQAVDIRIARSTAPTGISRDASLAVADAEDVSLVAAI